MSTTGDLDTSGTDCEVWPIRGFLWYINSDPQTNRQKLRARMGTDDYTLPPEKEKETEI